MTDHLHDLMMKGLGFEPKRDREGEAYLKARGLVRPALETELALWNALRTALTPGSEVSEAARAVAAKRDGSNGSHPVSEGSRGTDSGPSGLRSDVLPGEWPGGGWGE